VKLRRFPSRPQTLFLVYLGYQAAFPEGEALVVPKSSAINSVAGLKGKKVMLNKGSNVHSFSREGAGAVRAEIHGCAHRVSAPPEARAAFEAGSGDAGGPFGIPS
jgi:sulfonate transport system substrate-binding protein